MEYREFGDTGWKVSQIALGTMQIGGGWGDTTDEDGIATVRAALDAGINFIDTADMYGFGKSEELVGKAVKGRREDVYIATKFGVQWQAGPEKMGLLPRVYTPEYARECIDASLTRLGTDYIDLYQAHNLSAELARSSGWFDAMDELIAEGKIRAVGITCGPGDFGVDDAIAAGKSGAKSIALAYHLLSQLPSRAAFPYLREKGVGVIARGPLAMGILAGAWDENTVFGDNDERRGWDRDDYVRRVQQARAFNFLVKDPVETPAQAALRFALSNRDVSTVLVGMQTPEQVAANMKVVDMGPFDVDDLHAIAEQYDSWDEHESKLPAHIAK